MSTNPAIVLASSSPRRQELLRSLGLEFEVRPSGADESVEPGLPPEEIVESLAIRKALHVCGELRGEGRTGLVVGSDTIVVLDGQVLGKPADAEDAFRMLKLLQGRTHQVYTGVALLDAGGVRSEALGLGGRDGRTAVRFGDIGRYRIVPDSPAGRPEAAAGHTVSQVTFHPMSDEEIRSYVNTGEPLDKAGAYGVQGIGSVFIEKIEGDFYSIMGLPLNLLYQMLLMFGISLFNQS
ncbi:Maf family protein [Paenibacillus thermoaerophilus]|uniref:dTTP/UTP pyrophosphatase n=1 Tax=Paenibacillus thermoaerophilus TaxID=1215385 RepID=A0ABW2V541_9BACL|nr:Maf family protein [Paenibacillus thermoaerophilus]TMV11112.1 Maf-like protein [Paenibacillus thermoaerophilus]